VAAGLGVTAVAQAATVSVSTASPNTVTFNADPGEVNTLDVPITAQFTFTDSIAQLAAGSGCVSLNQHSATCQVLFIGAYTVNAYLGDQSDTAHVAVNGSHVSLWGEGGDDSLSADNFGFGGTSVYGGPGDDRVAAGGEGGQVSDGGPGNDVVRAGGFVGGASGFGGPGNDIITANWGIPYQAFGTLDGGSGNDSIVAQPTGFPSTASGGSGNDVIAIEGPAPGGPANGAYTITGGSGNDLLTGGVGNDTIDGGDGNDRIDVRGGGSDTVTCGSGQDVVFYDATDTIAGDCEVAILR
jgi:Ca2+-binding RTX toxin-like protein